MRLRSQRAFTLFELMVAIALVALIIGVVVSRMDDYLELDMKKTSNKLGSTIRYLYNKSATDGIYIRLILDITERTYWVEATSDPLKISAETDVEESGKKSDEGGEEGEATQAGEETADENGVVKLKYPKPSFGQVTSFLLKPSKLPDSVFFKDVFVEHRPSGVEAGKVAIHFFPNGYVELAIINLRNEEDDYFYSIKTNPATGKVSIENTYRVMEGK